MFAGGLATGRLTGSLLSASHWICECTSIKDGGVCLFSVRVTMEIGCGRYDVYTSGFGVWGSTKNK